MRHVLKSTFQHDPRYNRSLIDVKMPSVSETVGNVTEEHSSYYVIRDRNGQGLAYIYYENEPGRRRVAKLLSKDEARRIAANFATLPELMRR
jgi:hypothetical protein